MAKQPSSVPWATLVTIVAACASAIGVYTYLMRQVNAPAATGRPVESASQKPLAGSPVLALSEPERRFLWDVEHEAFVLSNVVFPEMAGAIRQDDRDGVSRRFDVEVAGRLPNGVPATDGHKRWDVKQWSAEDGSGSVAADRAGIVEFMWRLRGGFRELAGVQWAVMQLAPDDRQTLDGPWSGTTLVRLWGTSYGGWPRELNVRASFRTRAKPDLGEDRVAPITEWNVTSLRVAESADFLLRESAAEHGIDVSHFHDNWNFPDETPRLVTGGVYVCDYDDDGWLDVLITDSNGTRLYHNGRGGKFEDVTAQTGLSAVAEQGAVPAGFADLDGDGWPDLILGTQFFWNLKGVGFVPVLTANRLLPSDVASYTVADYDRDGRVDLYMTRGSRGPDVSPRRLAWLDDASGPGNLLWHNLGDWQFEDVTTATHTAAGNRSCFSAAWLDANDDGWPDLFVADEFGSPLLLVNRRGQRFEEKNISGRFGGFCMGVVAGDVDNDGRNDLYLANMYSKAGNRILANLDPKSYPPDVYARVREFTGGSELYLNRGGLRFEKAGKKAGVGPVGWAYGPCFVDLDNDGWLDIYAPAGFQSVSRSDPDG